MLVSRDWVEKKYTEFNNKFFGDKLPQFSDVNFKITTSKSFWGRAGCTRWQKNWRTGEYYAYGAILEMSNYHDSEEWVLENTLAHEMVHLYEFFVEPQYVQKHLLTGHYSAEYPRDGHGLIFYREAERLKQYGLNIARFVSTDEENASVLNPEIQQKIDKKVKKGITFLVATLSEPRASSKGIVCSVLYTPVTARTYKEKLQQMVNLRTYKIQNIDEYVSHDTKAILKSPGKGRFYMYQNLEDLIKKYSLELVKNIKNEQTDVSGVLKGSGAIRNFINGVSREYAKYLTDYIIKKDKERYDDYDDEYRIISFTVKIKIQNQPLTFKVNYGRYGIAENTGEVYIQLENGLWGSTAEAISYATDDEDNYQEAIDKVEWDLRRSIGLPPTQEEPQQPQKQLFRIKTSKGAVEIEYVNDDDLRAQLTERFPKLNAEAIQKLMENPANHVNNEAVSFFGQIVTEVLDSLQRNGSELGLSKDEIEQLPDELPGMTVVN